MSESNYQYEVENNKQMADRIEEGWAPIWMPLEDFSELLEILDRQGYDITRVSTTGLEFSQTPAKPQDNFVAFHYFDVDENGKRIIDPVAKVRPGLEAYKYRPVRLTF